MNRFWQFGNRLIQENLQTSYKRAWAIQLQQCRHSTPSILDAFHWRKCCFKLCIRYAVCTKCFCITKLPRWMKQWPHSSFSSFFFICCKCVTIERLQKCEREIEKKMQIVSTHSNKNTDQLIYHTEKLYSLRSKYSNTTTHIWNGYGKALFCIIEYK